MKAMTRILTLVVAVAMAAPAMADWNLGDPVKMHWPQLPDLDNGMNVEVTSPTVLGTEHVLADDFLCTETGPITDIHIWGSWLYDQFPAPERPWSPGKVHFHLGIYSDIPASQSSTGYSMPGELLWTEGLNGNKFRLWAESHEDFFLPGTNQIVGTDSLVFQYNFFNFEEPFVQEQDTIYWLSVTAFPDSPPGMPVDLLFGWKTSDRHWNDDAVFWVERSDGTSSTPQELIHPRTGESLDLAFVITPEPATLALLGVGGLAMLRRRLKRRADR